MTPDSPPPDTGVATTAVVGASGYVGRRLAARLASDGHRVIAIGRRKDELPTGPGIERRPADMADHDAAVAALAGAEVAYYLVHAMADSPRFAERDRQTARVVSGAAQQAGVHRLVYLGGLGREDASAHLDSRHEVGRILAAGGFPVVELRAAVVIGSGSISFEMLRYLTERLPVMVCPRWIETRLQPIAEPELLDVLVRAPGSAPGVYEIGSPEVTTYHEMIQAYARVRGLPRRRIVRVPLLTPRLSSWWVDLVTPVDRQVSHALVDSLRTEVVVEASHDEAVLGRSTMSVEEAIDAALEGQYRGVAERIWRLPPGLSDGVYVMRATAPLERVGERAVHDDLGAVGGDLRWYGVSWAWWLRLGLGLLIGERLTLGRSPAVVAGARADWWTVVEADERTLVLAARWKIGDAWLAYRAPPDAPGDVGRERHLEQVAAFRPRGLSGLVYWRILWPVHRLVFRSMVRHRVRSIGRAGRRVVAGG